MPIFMIITLGTGRGVENGIARSIRDNQPPAVCFVATPESRQEMPDKIVEALTVKFGVAMPPYTIKLIDHAADIEDIFRVTSEAIQEARQQGYGPDDIVLDFTSGTKAMSVGAGLAAFLSGCRKMVYVGGFQRDPETGRVVSDKELVMTFTLKDLHRNTEENRNHDMTEPFSFFGPVRL